MPGALDGFRVIDLTRVISGPVATRILADVPLTSCLTWARFVGIALPPTLADYQGRTTARPAYAAAMRVDFPPAALAMSSRGGAAPAPLGGS